LRTIAQIKIVGKKPFSEKGIIRLADTIKVVETRRDAVSQSLQNDLINGLQKSIKPDEGEIAQFEADYKKTRSKMRETISKLEVNSKKAGKKNPGELQKTIQELNEKIKEADQLKAEKLRNVLMLERKKFCNFLTQWLPVITSEIHMHQDGMKFQEQEQQWKMLASSQQLPSSMEELITTKNTNERTFVQLQQEGGGYQNDYTYDAYEDSYDSQAYSKGGSIGTLGYPAPPPPAVYGVATCVALYDFAGEQAEDLSFYARDIITILKEDDGSGWLTGELNGAQGIFPASYIQRH